MKFGRLTILGPVGKRGSHTYSRCRCDCGEIRECRTTHLRTGRITSCGCSRVKHGVARGHRSPASAKPPEYHAWKDATKRCENPRAQHYHRYGGRGIRMCDEWRHDFAAFLAHIGPRPGPGYSLDRIDNDGHYEPGNVRWATVLEQQRNRS